MFNKKQPTILIADDDEAVRSSLCAYFEDLGCSVLEAATAGLAIQKATNVSLDAAIIDLRLPDKDGLSLVDHLLDKCPQTIFVIYTGSTDFTLPQALQGCSRIVSKVFIKPVDMDELSRTLFEYLTPLP